MGQVLVSRLESTTMCVKLNFTVVKLILTLVKITFEGTYLPISKAYFYILTNISNLICKFLSLVGDKEQKNSGSQPPRAVQGAERGTPLAPGGS